MGSVMIGLGSVPIVVAVVQEVKQLTTVLTGNIQTQRSV